MKNQTSNFPDEKYVEQIVRRIFGESAVKILRFPTGLCHYVYDVMTESGKSVVVRAARTENRSMLADSLYWHRLLKPAGVPLPDLIYAEIDNANAFPFVILERLAGADLGLVYKQLTKAEKKSLAAKITEIQNIVGALPPGKGFGFVGNYESGFFLKSWLDVLHGSLERSRKRMQSVGAVNPHIVDRVAQKLDKFANYFSRVKPQGFLDDITTKNVIIHQGGLSGIVDVDFICFGDNLYTVALTQMSLLRSAFDLDYIEFWKEEMQIDDEQKSVLQLYTAIFCVDFMSELGQKFNKEIPIAIESDDLLKLNDILDSLLNEI